MIEMSGDDPTVVPPDDAPSSAPSWQLRHRVGFGLMFVLVHTLLGFILLFIGDSLRDWTLSYWWEFFPLGWVSDWVNQRVPSQRQVPLHQTGLANSVLIGFLISFIVFRGKRKRRG
jgi:hypothetical protein